MGPEQESQQTIQKQPSHASEPKESTDPEKSPKLRFSFNAIQAGYVAQEFGATNNNYRFRGYFGARIEGARFHIGANGINEFGANYEFGRNVVSAGKNDVPVEFIVASRHEGVGLTKAQVSDVAVGIRINLKQNKLFDRGIVDVLKHTGIGTSNYAGPEIVTLVGKTIHGADADLLISKKNGSPLFTEFELTLKPFTNIKGAELRPVVRGEATGFEKATFVAALQVQFPSR